jgi:hypothetical protein
MVLWHAWFLAPAMNQPPRDAWYDTVSCLVSSTMNAGSHSGLGAMLLWHTWFLAPGVNAATAG